MKLAIVLVLLVVGSLVISLAEPVVVYPNSIQLDHH